MPVVQYSRASTYAERLLVAHFAIMLVGLVAVVGAWRDSSLSFSMMVGALALLALAAWWLIHVRRTRLVVQPTYTACCLGWLSTTVSTWHSWAFFLRRANRLAGPPTWFVLPFVRVSVWRALCSSSAHLFCFVSAAYMRGVLAHVLQTASGGKVSCPWHLFR